MECCKCKKTALYQDGGVGFCRDHRQDAVKATLRQSNRIERVTQLNNMIRREEMLTQVGATGAEFQSGFRSASFRSSYIGAARTRYNAKHNYDFPRKTA